MERKEMINEFLKAMDDVMDVYKLLLSETEELDMKKSKRILNRAGSLLEKVKSELDTESYEKFYKHLKEIRTLYTQRCLGDLGKVLDIRIY